MKILFYIESLRSGGKERRLVELIKGLSNNTNYSIGIVLTKKEIHYTEIFNYKINIYYTIRKGINKDPRVFLSFYKIAKSFKPDVIHVWGNLAAIYAIPAKTFLKIPMINSQITDAPEKISNSLLSHRLAFPFSDEIIANSYAGLKAYSTPKHKSSVIYNGFDFSRVCTLQDENLIKNKFKINSEVIVGMVASFSEKKDYSSYITAANMVLKNHPNTTFLCIGSGNDNIYRKMVHIKYCNNIIFLGKQNNVESIMNICDIGVLATYTEGISNALMEFSALGKPIITNFGGGNIELVDDNVTGYLIKQRSPKELAEKIIALINDEGKRRRFGEAGRRKIKHKFSINKMINSFINVYQGYSS